MIDVGTNGEIGQTRTVPPPVERDDSKDGGVKNDEKFVLGVTHDDGRYVTFSLAIINKSRQVCLLSYGDSRRRMVQDVLAASSAAASSGVAASNYVADGVRGVKSTVWITDVVAVGDMLAGVLHKQEAAKGNETQLARTPAVRIPAPSNV